MTRLPTSLLIFALAGCASSADGRYEAARPVSDVPPGVNPDGDDPFRPRDAGPILIDGSTDVDNWTLPDASVFDQRYAYIWVGAYRTGVTDGAYASAEFRLTPRPEDPRCEYVSAGSWDVVTCDSEGTAPMDTHARPFPHAGAITIRGGVENVSLNPMGGTGQYMYFYEERNVFDGPRRVEVRAMGSTAVPMFSIMADVPSALVLTEPEVRSPGVINVTRNEDFVVAWRPLTARSVNVSLAATGTRAGRRVSITVYAELPASAGRGVIPRRAIQSLSSLMSIEGLNFRATPQNLLTQRVGSWPVQVVSSGRAVTATAVLQ